MLRFYTHSHTAFCILLAAFDVAHAVELNPDAFAHPASTHRPSFRYWLPDASVPSDIVVKDVVSNSRIGAGGFEFVPFFEYGGEIGAMPEGADWGTYGFGTEPFRKLLKSALQAHESEGLYMDVALGPNQGQGVPADPTNEGLQWDLIPYTKDVAKSGKFEGTIPGWGDGKLLSLVSALVVSNETSGGGDAGPLLEDFTLSAESLKQQKDSVNKNTGQASLKLPRANEGSHYRLFAFYERLSGNQNLHFESPRQETIFDGGSYAVDHFDGRGARVTAKFWEDYILDDVIREQLSKVGRYAWEDSLELKSNITWSHSLPRRFRKLHDYDILNYLPLVAYGNNNLAVQADTPGEFRCVLDSSDKGERHVNNYRATLEDGHQEYLRTLADWVHKTLGMQLSVQPGYGIPMDMQALIPLVDAPECESLSFFDSIDAYRQFSGPAMLAGRNIISNEMGAVRNGAYAYHLTDLLVSVHRAFVGGVNRAVIHGQAYSADYFETTWPGHTPFGYLFADSWSERMPTWSLTFPQVIDYISRLQFLLQQGTAKADVAVYNKESASRMQRGYQASDLVDDGWSFHYLSPDNLHLPTAKVVDGVLSAEGPGWKAFVLESSQNLTAAAIRSLKVFAEDGLPVIVAGGQPKSFPFGKDFDQDAFDKDFSSLIETVNVHSVESGKVSEKLQELRIKPIAKFSTETGQAPPFSVWREDGDVGYLFLYADITPWSGHVALSNVANPRRLDLWTGTIDEQSVFIETKSGLSIPVELAGNQTTAYRFDTSARGSGQHLISKTPNVLRAQIHGDETVLHLARSNSTEVVLSDNTKITIDATNIPPTFELSNWALTAEHWEAPEDLMDSTKTSHLNTTHNLSGKLDSLTKIPGLVNSSGVGYYTTTFPWPPKGSCKHRNLGAMLSLESIPDGAVIHVNGKPIPSIDLARPTANITSALIDGDNTVDIVVPTTLWNYLRTILYELKTADSVPLPITLEQALGIPMNGPTEAGLQGAVNITPVRMVVV